MGWNRDSEARLAQLWADGLTMTQIGAVLRKSKNAVAGKVHRLNLTPRPSPIKTVRDGQVKRGMVWRPPMDGVVRKGKRGVLGGGTLAALGVVPQPAARPVMVAPVRAVVVPVTFPRASQPCCWPIGEPRTKGFRYCDAAGVPGRSYCAAHCAEAYVSVRERSEAELAADAVRRLRQVAIGERRSVAGLDWSGR